MGKISVAIPVFNSSKYLDSLIKRLIKYKSVGEIVIFDDYSDNQDFENTKKIVEKYSKSKIPIHLYRNNENLGAFKTKYKSIEKCSFDVVYQIDSDNLPMFKFDKFVKENIFTDFNNENIYYPSKIYQFYQFPYLSLITSRVNKKFRVYIQKVDFKVDKEVLKDALINNKSITHEKNLRWLTNIGNFFVDKNNFLNATKEGLSMEKNDLAVDAVAITYYWVKNYSYIVQKKNHYHFHRKRDDSISVVTKNITDKNFEQFETKIKSL